MAEKLIEIQYPDPKLIQLEIGPIIFENFVLPYEESIQCAKFYAALLTTLNIYFLILFFLQRTLSKSPSLWPRIILSFLGCAILHHLSLFPPYMAWRLASSISCAFATCRTFDILFHQKRLPSLRWYIHGLLNMGPIYPPESLKKFDDKKEYKIEKPTHSTKNIRVTPFWFAVNGILAVFGSLWIYGKMLQLRIFENNGNNFLDAEYYEIWVRLFMVGIHLHMTLLAFMSLLSFLACFLSDDGKEEPIFNYPYLSSSFRNFWSKRWNLAVSRYFAQQIYKPLIALKYSPAVAALAVFLISGLIHEYFSYHAFNGISVGTQLIYFCSSGIIVVIQFAVKRKTNFFHNVPRVISIPVFWFTFVPFGYLYARAMIYSGLYLKSTPIVPRIYVDLEWFKSF